jgi:hypothetical protein
VRELLLQVGVLEGAVAAFETERSLCSKRRGSEVPPEAAVGTGKGTGTSNKERAGGCASRLSERSSDADASAPNEHTYGHRWKDVFTNDGLLSPMHGYAPRHAASALIPSPNTRKRGPSARWPGHACETDAARRETAPFSTGMHKRSERDSKARELDA